MHFIADIYGLWYQSIWQLTLSSVFTIQLRKQSNHFHVSSCACWIVGCFVFWVSYDVKALSCLLIIFLRLALFLAKWFTDFFRTHHIYEYWQVTYRSLICWIAALNHFTIMLHHFAFSCLVYCVVFVETTKCKNKQQMLLLLVICICLARWK